MTSPLLWLANRPIIGFDQASNSPKRKPKGYTRAYAEPVPGETNTVDNAFVYGWVLVTIPGDVDGDRDVDIFDIIRMAGAYGAKQGSPEYIANCEPRRRRRQRHLRHRRRRRPLRHQLVAPVALPSFFSVSTRTYGPARATGQLFYAAWACATLEKRGRVTPSITI